MSTIGYGDVSPTNVLERVFACLVMLFGNVVFAYGITNVVTASPTPTARHVTSSSGSTI